jgi:hypothetical protein
LCVERLQVVVRRHQRAVAQPLGEHEGGHGALAARGRTRQREIVW